MNRPNSSRAHPSPAGPANAAPSRLPMPHMISPAHVGDALSDVLRNVRLASWPSAVSDFDKPWSLRVPTGQGGFLAVLAGEMSLQVDLDHGPRVLHAGDIAIITRGEFFRIGDSHTTPSRELHEEITAKMMRSHGGPRKGSGRPLTRFIGAGFRFEGHNAATLCGSLPVVVVLPGHDSAFGSMARAAVELLSRQVEDGSPGTHAVMNHLVGVIFCQAVRAQLGDRSADQRFLSALADENVGPVIGLMHAEPAREWTLENLAIEAGLSRTTFHERFVGLLETPPLTYLRDLRLRLAADSICQDGMSLREIARRVGYGSEGGLCSAFKRWSGLTPGEYRERHRRANSA